MTSPNQLRPILLAVLILGASACASFGTPTPVTWEAGSYAFQAVLEGRTIYGVIEVDEDGPTYVDTSLSRCTQPMSPVVHPWSRGRTFTCAGDYRLSVSIGTKAGPPIQGSMSNTRTVTEDKVTRTCVARDTDEDGVTRCVEWREDVEQVTRPVTESARILLIAPGPSGSGPSSGSPRSGE